MKKLILKTIAIAVVLGLLVACHLINMELGLKDDNKIEEAVEDLVDEELDIELDLTPNSSEIKNAS